MAVTKVTQSWEGREYEESENGSAYSQVYTVEFDDRDDPQARLILAKTARDPSTGLTIPQYGEKHKFDETLFVKNRNIKQQENDGVLICVVTCKYSVRTFPTAGENPLAQKPKKRWTFVTSDLPIDRDINDNPILNSADESFDPPVTDDKYDLVLQYERNVRKYDPALARAYIGAVNSGTFLGFAPGIAKLVIWEGDVINDDKYGEYVHEVIEIHFRQDVVKGKKYGWVKRILDQGYSEKFWNADDGIYEYGMILDRDNNIKSEPTLLDGKGRVIDQTTDDVNKRLGVYLVFETKKKLPFSVLNIKV